MSGVQASLPCLDDAEIQSGAPNPGPGYYTYRGIKEGKLLLTEYFALPLSSAYRFLFTQWFKEHATFVMTEAPCQPVMAATPVGDCQRAGTGYVCPLPGAQTWLNRESWEPHHLMVLCGQWRPPALGRTKQRARGVDLWWEHSYIAFLLRLVFADKDFQDEKLKAAVYLIFAREKFSLDTLERLAAYCWFPRPFKEPYRPYSMRYLLLSERRKRLEMLALRYYEQAYTPNGYAFVQYDEPKYREKLPWREKLKKVADHVSDVWPRVQNIASQSLEQQAALLLHQVASSKAQPLAPVQNVPGFLRHVFRADVSEKIWLVYAAVLSAKASLWQGRKLADMLGEIILRYCSPYTRLHGLDLEFEAYLFRNSASKPVLNYLKRLLRSDACFREAVAASLELCRERENARLRSEPATTPMLQWLWDNQRHLFLSYEGALPAR